MKTQTALIFSAVVLASTVQTGALALESETNNISAGRTLLATGYVPLPQKTPGETSTAESSAAESSTSKATDKTDKQDSKQSKSKTEKAKHARGKSYGPGAMASFVAGAVGGLPIACARKISDELHEANHDLIDDRKNPVFVVPATMISLPFAIPIGTVFGTYYAVKNSWTNKTVKPFSKDAFSLGPDF